MSLLDLDDALLRIRSLLTCVAETERLPLDAALGRSCAKDLRAPADIPSFANSAMDGYAVQWHAALEQQVPIELTQIGASFAGHAFAGRLTQPTDCIRIFTGAPMPEGADTVVIQENVRAAGDRISVLEPATKGQWVRMAGHDLRAGALVVGAGTRLRAQHIGLCTAAGLTHVEVRRTVRVAVMSNGDELIDAGQPLAPGQIYDSNRATLKALLASEPVTVIDLGRVADTEAAIQSAIDLARAQAADLLLCSGGVSVGDADLVRQVVQRNGEIDFWRIAIKPGKPLAFARLQPLASAPPAESPAHTAHAPGACWFIGLPGNPVSTFITYQTIVRAALDHLAGITPRAATIVAAQLQHAIERDAGRLELQRGILTIGADGGARVRNTGNQSSGMLSSVVAANCFILLPREQGAAAEGDWVQVLPFEGAL